MKSVLPRDDASSWDEAYEALVERLRAQCGEAEVPAHGERRSDPRFRLKGTLGVQLQAQFPAVDLSVDGLSFQSMLEIPVGKVVNVVLGGAFLSEVAVIACEQTPLPDHPGHPWRVHGRFLHPREGMRILLMLDSMEGLGLLKSH